MRVKRSQLYQGFIVFVFMVTPYLLFAQIEKGTFSIGPEFTGYAITEPTGNIVFLQARYDGDAEGTATSLNLNMSYFVINNLSVGLNVGYAYLTMPGFVGDDYNMFRFGVGPRGKYFVNLGEETFMSIGTGITYNWINDDDSKITGVEIPIELAFHYIVSNKIGAYIGLGPHFASEKYDDEGSVFDNFDQTLIRVNFGFNIYF